MTERWKQCVNLDGTGNIRNLFYLKILRTSDPTCFDKHVRGGFRSLAIVEYPCSLAIRPHRAYSIHAAYCYRQSGVVCLCVCLSQSRAMHNRLNRSRCRLRYLPKRLSNRQILFLLRHLIYHSFKRKVCTNPLRGLLPISLLCEERHDGCKQFA